MVIKHICCTQTCQVSSTTHYPSRFEFTWVHHFIESYRSHAHMRHPLHVNFFQASSLRDLSTWCIGRKMISTRLENPQSIKCSFIGTLPMQSCDTFLHRSWPSVHSLSFGNFELIRIIFKKSNEGIFLAEDTYRFPRNLLAAITLADSQSIKCSVDWESANVISPPGYLENY